jgi:hypothetical protein
MFPYNISLLNKGIKYLGFGLNPNAYCVKDRKWLSHTVEARIKT